MICPTHKLQSAPQCAPPPERFRDNGQQAGATASYPVTEATARSVLGIVVLRSARSILGIVVLCVHQRFNAPANGRARSRRPEVAVEAAVDRTEVGAGPV